jgi:hypothetical protein
MPNFIRLTKRLDEIKPILHTMIEFNRLDKTEVGGIHGHILSPRFLQLLDEFHDIEGKLTSMDFDLLRIPDAQFSAINSEVKAHFLDLDIRAVAIAVWAIQDVSSVVSLGQILTGFNALLRRPFFIESFQRQNSAIIALFNRDVERIAITYRLEKNAPPQLKGVPPTTSNFIW